MIDPTLVHKNVDRATRATPLNEAAIMPSLHNLLVEIDFLNDQLDRICSTVRSRDDIKGCAQDYPGDIEGRVRVVFEKIKYARESAAMLENSLVG